MGWTDSKGRPELVPGDWFLATATPSPRVIPAADIVANDLAVAHEDGVGRSPDDAVVDDASS